MKGILALAAVAVLGFLAWTQLGVTIKTDKPTVKPPSISAPDVNVNEVSRGAVKAGDAGIAQITMWSDTTWQIIVVILGVIGILFVWNRFPALKYIILGVSIAALIFVSFF